MSNKERIIKLVWGVKSVKNDKLKCMSEYTEKEIITMMTKGAQAKKKGKADKAEVITATVDGDENIKYKRYYFDSKEEFSYGDCAVNINVKGKNNKALTFEEKLTLLKTWMRKKNIAPKVGDMENDFDVGKFYQQSVTNVGKMNEVISTVEEYTTAEDDEE